MDPVWSKLVLRLGSLLLAGGLIGALYGEPVVGLLVAAVAAVAWQSWNLLRLNRWLHGEQLDFLPDGSGIWAQVFARIDFVRSRSRRRSRRLRKFIKELRASAKMFPDGGIILNSRNEIVIFNRAARDLLGLRKRLDRGQRIENLIRNPEFIEYLASGEFKNPVEIESQDHGWLSCHLVPYGPDQRLLLVRDISKQRESEQMRKDFVANASHELRTPLTVISGYVDALAAEKGLPEDLRDPVAEMQRQTLRMQNLVADLLKLSELEADERPVDGDPVNLAPVLESARQEALATDGCPATIEVVLDSDKAIRGEEDQIQSVVSNLVSNAVRHTPEDGTITIRWAEENGGGCLSVIDTGCGIASEHLNRLSERFYRVENGRQRAEGDNGGTGLGLAIVKHALLRHDAALEIESEYGKGSEFRCRFPKSRLV